MSVDLDDVDVIVVVGTDHHPFGRLVAWVDRWAAARSTGDRCLVQYGTAAPPLHTQAVDYLRRDALLAGFAAARVVVCHGGPSTIIEALRSDRMPIVLPRSPAHGEHVDGHQEQFAAVMAAKQMIRLVEDEATLFAWLDAELANDGPTPVVVDLPPPEVAALELGRRVAALTASGPTRRLRLLRRLAHRA